MTGEMSHCNCMGVEGRKTAIHNDQCTKRHGWHHTDD